MLLLLDVRLAQGPRPSASMLTSKCLASESPSSTSSPSLCMHVITHSSYKLSLLLGCSHSMYSGLPSCFCSDSWSWPRTRHGHLAQHFQEPFEVTHVCKSLYCILNGDGGVFPFSERTYLQVLVNNTIMIRRRERHARSSCSRLAIGMNLFWKSTLSVSTSPLVFTWPRVRRADPQGCTQCTQTCGRSLK